MTARTAYIFYFLCVCGCLGQEAVEETVQIDSGPVRGYRRQADVGTYVSYRGIPYAKQPVGERRFKPLEEADPWIDVYDALNEGPICPQSDVLYGTLMTSSGMSEECIHINVHVPEGEKATESMPVFVFVHGGAFGMGSADADIQGPEYLVSKGIVVVTFNYRLGALGFLSIAAKELPGNLGMRDMVAALRWVKRNIAAFKGDPDNVTIGGQSAGSVATHLLTLSNMTEGLFHRAIMMSGVGIRSWATTSPKNAAEHASSFLQNLGITATDPQEIMDALQAANVTDILTAATIVQTSDIIPRFYPVVEDKFDGVEPFLCEDPYEIVISGRSRDIPTIIGFTDRESYSFTPVLTASDVMDYLKTNPEYLLPSSLKYASDSDQLEERISKMKTRYFGTDDFSNGTFENYLSSVRESWFQYPALKLARINSKLLSSPVYLYQFSFVGDYTPLQQLIPGYPGAYHLQDLFFVLKLNSYTNQTIEPGSRDEEVKDFMTTAFANLISLKTTSISEEWPTFTAEAKQNLNINNTFSVQDSAYEEMVQFYDELYSS